MRPMWEVRSASGPRALVEVTPIRDVRAHHEGPECWCGPETEWLDPDTGLPYENGPLVIHRAADGRE